MKTSQKDVSPLKQLEAITTYKPATVLFIVALAARIINIIVLSQLPGFRVPIVDEHDFNQMAIQFASGSGFFSDAFFRPPLWPAVLGVVYFLIGPDFLFARILNALLGAAATFAMYRIGCRLFTPRIAWFATLFYAIYGLLVHLNTSGLGTSLTIFLILEATDLSLRAMENKKELHATFAGALWGLAALSHPLALAPAIITVVFLILYWHRKKESYPVLAAHSLVAILLIITPVTFINILHGEFIPISSNGGINFYMGNNARASGFTPMHPELGAWWNENSAHEWIESRVGRQLRQSEASAEYMNLAFDWMKKQPGHAIVLLLKKTYLAISSKEISNNGDLDTFIKQNLWLRLLILFGFPIFGPLGLAGLFLAGTENRKMVYIVLITLSQLFSPVLFFVNARFRAPTVPYLLLFAVFAISLLYGYYKNSRKKELSISLAGIVVLAVVLNANLLKVPAGDEAYGAFIKGQMLAQEGNMDEAKKAFEHALDIYPKVPLANYYIGRIHLTRAEPEKALERFKREIVVSRKPLGYLGQGLAYRALGMRKEAEASLIQAYSLDPEHKETRISLAQEVGERAIAAADTGNVAKSKVLLQQAARIDPWNPFYPFSIATLIWVEGDTLEAERQVDELLKKYPTFPPAIQWRRDGWRPDQEIN